MSIEKRSTLDNITKDPENILQMEPTSCDFGRFAEPECGIEVVAKTTPVTPPPPTPVLSYTLTANKTSTNEGDTIIITLQGNSLAVSGTSVPYTITGITAADLTTGSLTGNFILDDLLKGSITLIIKSDSLTEGTETLRIASGVNYSTILNITILDTSKTPVQIYNVYYGNGIDEYSSESNILAFTSKSVTTKVGSYSFPEAGETEEIVYKWIFIPTGLGAVTDLTKFKVGTFSANMISKGTIGGYYAYRTNNMAFGAVTITLES
jgi:hypothetical protein